MPFGPLDLLFPLRGGLWRHPKCHRNAITKTRVLYTATDVCAYKVPLATTSVSTSHLKSPQAFPKHRSLMPAGSDYRVALALFARPPPYTHKECEAAFIVEPQDPGSTQELYEFSLVADPARAFAVTPQFKAFSSKAVFYQDHRLSAVVNLCGLRSSVETGNEYMTRILGLAAAQANEPRKGTNTTIRRSLLMPASGDYCPDWVRFVMTSVSTP